MDSSPLSNQYTGLSRLKLFFALSRTPHGLLDMATPPFCALLWLGSFPSLKVILIGLITAFAGYSAVYALNDIIDINTDKEKIKKRKFDGPENYLDAIIVRHPMAQGMLNFEEGLLWAIAWSIVAVIGAYLLNPVCVLIFLAGCILEAIYCLMLRVSPIKTIVSGAVKTSGGIAAVFAVDPNPSAIFLLLIFLWFFFWEVGGQNIPADWTDINEDRQFKARTIPAGFGPKRSNGFILTSLSLAVFMSVFIFMFTAVRFEIYYVVACFLAGVFLLIYPAYQLYRTRKQRHVMALFNKASFYPVTMLLIVTLKALI